jgi:hypothetical protein
VHVLLSLGETRPHLKQIEVSKGCSRIGWSDIGRGRNSHKNLASRKHVSTVDCMGLYHLVKRQMA